MTDRNADGSAGSTPRSKPLSVDQQKFLGLLRRFPMQAPRSEVEHEFVVEQYDKEWNNSHTSGQTNSIINSLVKRGLIRWEKAALVLSDDGASNA